MGKSNNILQRHIKGKLSKATTTAMLMLSLLGGSGCNTKDQSAPQTSQEWKNTDGSQHEDGSALKNPQDWNSPNPSAHEVRLDTIMPDGTYHINPYYLKMLKDTLERYMTTFTQKKYDTLIQNPDMFFNFAKSHYDTLEQTTYTKLDINEKKEKLEEARKKGDVEVVKQLEHKYATDILQEIYSYPSNQESLPNVSDIMSYKIECVEKTLLCHIFLEALGISHSIALLPWHAALVVHLGGEDRYMDPTNLSELKKIDLSKYQQEGAYYVIPGLYVPQDDQRYPENGYRNRIRLGGPETLKSMIWGNMGRGEDDWEQATKYYQQALKLDPKNVDAWYNMGDIYIEGGGNKNLTEAIKCYQKVVELDPKNVDAWYIMGMIYRELGGENNWGGAITCYKKVLELEPKDADAWYIWYNMGMIYRELGGENNLKEAITCYKKALELDPKDADAWYIWYNMGMIYRELGGENNLKEAITCYKKVLELEPKNAGAWYNMGMIYRELGKDDRGGEDNLKEAITCYKKALELDPKHANAWYNMGISYHKLGKDDRGGEDNLKEAITCYKKALELNPKHANAWYNMGIIYLFLQDYENFIKCRDECKKLDEKFKKKIEGHKFYKFYIYYKKMCESK